MGIVIKSNIKKVVTDMQVAEEVGPALDRKVEEMLLKAAERAKANNRRTVFARDL